MFINALGWAKNHYFYLWNNPVEHRFAIPRNQHSDGRAW
jgi:hypothetical protein